MRKNRFQTNSFIKKYQNLINQINNLEESLKVLSDSELRAKNFKLKKRFEENQNLDPLIAESFALTREASLRTVGLRHFDVQLIGGCCGTTPEHIKYLSSIIDEIIDNERKKFI